MSVSSDLKGVSKIINNLPKYFLYIIVVAVILEFFPSLNIFTPINTTQTTKTRYTLEGGEAYATSSININSKYLQGYKIISVVDGDTLNISNGTEKIKVRLLGINTPESVDPNRPVECYGKEASKYVKDNYSNRDVYAEPDPSQSTYDKYGRLLAYVYTKEGEMINRKLVEEGYAYEYTYAKPYKYQKDFKHLESLARNENKGLWSPNTCNGQK